ncbi:hypothetical protein [Streptomyces sp. KLOTTS4A1]|uniref:hypothetical protein n=1 Tax=Streptomyces sp. KLOTTS4A1 TaxID=3390996 RepID=UPI0039F5CD8C
MSYEDELSEALRRTGEGFSTDHHALVEAGHVRGRRMARRRRRAAVFGGAAAVAALAVTGAVAVPGMTGGGDRARPAAGGGAVASASGGSSAATASAEEGESAAADGKGVSKEQLVETLTSLLPDGKVGASFGRGTEEGTGMAYARVVFDDGMGKASVSVSFEQVDDADGKQTEQRTTCPDRVLVKHDACSVRTLEDGSRLMVYQGYVYSDHRADVKDWYALLVTPEGHLVRAGELNAVEEKGTPTTRPEPPLSVDQLTSLATSDKWDPVFDAPMADPGSAWPDGQPGGDGKGKEGKEGKEGPGEAEPPPAVLGQKEIRARFVSLLPEGIKVLKQGGEGEWAYLVVDDGKGASMVQINVQPGMNDVRGQLFAGGETLPDGVMYQWRESGGEQGVEGGVMWTADTIRLDGLRVVVSAFNAGTQHDAPTRRTPALDQEQLKAIAASAEWAGMREK